MEGKSALMDGKVSRGRQDFDESYYREGCGPDPYQRTEAWLNFYRQIAVELRRSLNPHRILDAGCALGMLTEAFWDLGVDAYGVDISEYAIDNVRPDMRPFCRVASLADPIEGWFDLVTCIEVLEHMPADDAGRAIHNLCQITDTILLSTSPTDFEEITHVNVRPISSWLKLFGEKGFWPDLEYDASFITPQAMLLRRKEALPEDVLSCFQQTLTLKIRLQQNEAQKETAEQQKARAVALEARIETLQGQLAEANDTADSAAARAIALEARIETLQSQLAEASHTADSARAQAEAQQAARAVALEARIEALQSQLAEANAIVDSLKTQLAALEGSTFWRMTAPMRATLSATSPSLRRIVRRGAKAAYWAVTPHRLSARVRFLRERKQQRLLASPADAGTPTVCEKQHPAIAQQPASRAEILLSTPQPASASARTISKILNEELNYLSALPVFRIPERDRQRVTIVTDSINSGSFFGGVATSLIFAALMARRLGADLRIVTLNESAATENIAELFSCHDVAWQDNIAFSFVDIRGQHKPVDVAANDLFITTSWWSTRITKSAIPTEKILYILQEDERMFYPLGDQHLRCSEILHNSDIRVIVNTRMLYEYFIASGLEHLRDRGCWFEPSFPQSIYFRSEDNRSKKRFFFYARPHHPRNLYLRGLEAIRRAVDLNIFDPGEWDFVFAGSNIPNINVSDDVKVEIVENLPWREYAELLRSVDLGLSLMYTPHPSYPPLDLAASEAIVVTNRFGPKQDLSPYSENIIMADLDLDALVEGLKRGVQLAADKTQRQANYERNGLLRDWRVSFEPTLDFLFGR